MDANVQQLEDEVELLRTQLESVTGTSQEVGALLTIGYGMTERLATMLFILTKRAPAVVSKRAFHSIIYGNCEDGGPEPSIFGVHICRLRQVLQRAGVPGKINTIWGSGYRADPTLVSWVKGFFKTYIPQEE